MARKKKKIALLFASGSILSIRNNKSVFFVSQESDCDQWLSEIPELSLLADITPFYILNEDQEFSLDTIETITRTINDHKNDFEGFVVIVRADRILYASCALEFMMQGFGKPVICTGSRYSPDSIPMQDMRKIVKMGGLGLRSNIINAVQIANDDAFPAVVIMFGNKVIKPTKAQFGPFYAMNLFRSADDDYLGKVDFGISLQRSKVFHSDNPRPSAVLSRHIRTADIRTIGEIEKCIPNEEHTRTSLLLRASENQVLAVELLDRLKKHFSSVILTNPHFLLDQRGVLLMPHMTWHSAWAKVHWAHALAKDDEEFETLLSEDSIGEYIYP